MKNYSGFTLVELLIVIALAAIMVAMGMPHFGEMVKDNRRAAEVNRFVSSLNLARTEALKRRTTVTVCKTSAPLAVTPDCDVAASWEDGWLIFVNLDGDDSPAAVDGGETVLRVSDAIGNDITLTGFGDFGNHVSYGFDGTLRVPATSTGGRFTFCDDRGAPAARAVLINNTGRARLSTDTDADDIHEDEANNDLTC